MHLNPKWESKYPAVKATLFVLGGLTCKGLSLIVSFKWRWSTCFPGFLAIPNPRKHTTNSCTAPVVWKVSISFSSAPYEEGEGEVTLIRIWGIDKQLPRGINWLVWGPSLRAWEFSGYMFCTLPSRHRFSKAWCFFPLSCPWKPLFKQNLTQKHEQIKQKKSRAALLKAGLGAQNTDRGSLLFLPGTARTWCDYATPSLIHSESKCIELWLIFLSLL